MSLLAGQIIENFVQNLIFAKLSLSSIFEFLITAVAPFTLEIRANLSSGRSEKPNAFETGQRLPEKTVSLVRPSEVMPSKTIYYLNFLTLLGEPQLIRCSVCQTKLIRDRMRCLTCFKEKVSNRPVIDMVSESPTPVCPIVDLRMAIPSSQRYKLWEAVAFKCHSEGFTLAKRKNPKPTPSTCLDREDFTCTMQKWS